MNASLQQIVTLATAVDAELSALTAAPLVVFPSLEYSPNWEQPGNVGDDGGGSSKPHGKGTITAPGDGALAHVAPVGDYDNFYFLNPLSATQATRFVRVMQLKFPTTADLAASQAIEWEGQVNTFGTELYNMAWQRRYDDLLSYFDYNTSQWVSKGIKCGIVAGQWMTFVCSFQRNPDKTLTHEAIAINHVVHWIEATQKSTAEKATPYFNTAIQLDGNATGEAYSVAFRDTWVTL